MGVFTSNSYPACRS